MRFPLSRLFLFAVLSCAAPLRAAVVEPVSLAPTLGMVQSAPGFQASVLSQIQLAASLSGQPAATVSLAPLTAAIAAPAPVSDPWRPEAARLVTALVAQPQSLSFNKEAIRAALGDQTYERLTKTASRFASKAPANAALQEQLAGIRQGLDLRDPAAVQEMGARLNSIFENSRAKPETAAPAVAAGAESGTHKPLVSLVHPGESPVMSHAELEAYVAARAVVTPRGMKRVNFASGDYKPSYDSVLRGLGVDMVVIKAPSRAELSRYKEEDGYHFKSEYERWVMTTRTLEEHKVALGKAQRVRQFENQLASSEKIHTELKPLTVENYEKWYPIYEDEVVGKPGGKRNVGLDFARKQAEKGSLNDWYGLFYYDPVDKTKIIGGVIMKAWPERGMFVLGYAAYRPELKDVNPSVRTFAESMKLAHGLGYKVLSFGQDTNFFGYDYSLGLMSNKAGFLLTPYPEDELVLMKVLNSSKIAAVKNGQGRTGGYFFFGVKRDSPVVERYLESKEAGAPKEAQDLLGSPHYFDGKVVSAKDTVVGWHYKGDDPNPLRVPVGIDVNDREMAPPGAVAGN
ncbi:MAG: hypothetical protein KGJ84_13345 [Elusimicrobia bacterium]|nr:hypothetical protein [Elusimicrobiota bacterium]